MSSSFARRYERVSVRLKNEAARRSTLFFSRLVLPRVGAPRVTFVTKTAMKCMRPHSLGDSTPKEFFSHFSRSVRVENPTASLPSLHVLVSGRERYTLGITRNTLPSFAAAKILTPLRGDTTPLHSFDRNRSPFCEKQKRLQVGRARKDLLRGAYRTFPTVSATDSKTYLCNRT